MPSELLDKSTKKELCPVNWDEANGAVLLIDQTKLPYELEYIEIKTHQEMARAIVDMEVRGAPAIGIAAAFGMALATRNSDAETISELSKDLKEADELLRTTRPTAVNLMWALDRMSKLLEEFLADTNKTDAIEDAFRKQLETLVLDEAKFILEDDIQRCKKISEVGADYIRNKFPGKKLKIMTHCNAGALATGGYGTALGVIRRLHEEGLVEMVYSNETRPRQQGARLTVWEMNYENIPVTLLADTMSAQVMKENKIDLVVVGSDRITANGDAANKIGTYQAAISANYHKIPFFVAAPMSTVDVSLKTGDEIPIEERSEKEVSHINNESCTVLEEDIQSVSFYNPGFDVTPNELVEQIFTEEGLFTRS